MARTGIRFPIVLSNHKRIVVVRRDWFSRIGSLNDEAGEVRIGVSRLGERSLAWFVDADGRFFQLEWQGKIRKSLVQLIGLSRQRELYSICEPREVSAMEMLRLIEDHSDQFEEAAHASNLRKALRAAPVVTPMGRDFMRAYLGE